MLSLGLNGSGEMENWVTTGTTGVTVEIWDT